MSNWEKSIVQGEWFEENVAKPWIAANRNSWWITDSRNHKRDGKSGGPKLTRNGNEITLPDFRLDDPTTGSSSWLDAKYKGTVFTIPGFSKGIKFVSLDTKAYADYKKVIDTFTYMPFEILFGIKFTKKLYLLDFKTVKPVWHMFDNGYVRKGDALTPCYSLKDMIEVDDWDPANMPQV